MLEILYEDEHCLALNKPVNLAVQSRSPGDDSLELFVRRYLAPDDPPSAYVGIVHRLDKPVSGVILWAKTTKAARRLAAQFSGRDVEKIYHAAVSPPRIGRDSGTWEDFLYEGDTGLGRVQVCMAGTPRARRAVTRFERMTGASSPESVSILTLRPETGRTHQLRVQTGSRGHPILGDSLYGSTVGFPEGIALHAAKLVVRHPITDQVLEIAAPHPKAWLEAGIAIS